MEDVTTHKNMKKLGQNITHHKSKLNSWKWQTWDISSHYRSPIQTNI